MMMMVVGGRMRGAIAESLMYFAFSFVSRVDSSTLHSL